jgi:hypothetical protein
MGNGQWAMGNGQWAMGNGQWAMGNGQWFFTYRPMPMASRLLLRQLLLPQFDLAAILLQQLVGAARIG